MQYSVKFAKKFIVKQFKNSTHNILILCRIEKMVWVVLFCVTRLDFWKSKSSFARKSQMWWFGRGNSGGSWLPEEKKANMWPGRGNSCGSWPPAFPRSLDRGLFKVVFLFQSFFGSRYCRASRLDISRISQLARNILVFH